MPSRSTELEAVNRLLTNAGKTPVDSLDTLSGPSQQALGVLGETSRSVQSLGWWFNTFSKVQYSPEDITGFIVLGNDIVSVDISPYDYSPLDVVQHGDKLYDKTNQTYVFTAPIVLIEIKLLDWDLLPQQAKEYVSARAVRVFQQRLLGTKSNQAVRLLQQDEAMALSVLKEHETDNGDYSVFDSPGPLSAIVRDRYRY